MANILDPVRNFTEVNVAIGYDASAVSIALLTGEGANLPDPSTEGAFNVVYYNATDYSDPSLDPNVEIVRVTGVSTDTVTIVRAQEGTSASTKNTVGKAYRMLITLTKKLRDDIDARIVMLNIASASAPASLDLAEDTDNGTNKITLTAPSAIASDKVITLPDVTGTVALLETVYPVGSVYINYSDSTNPGTLLGFGTWVATAVGRAIVGIDAGQTEFDTAGETGGAKTHTLTGSESGTSVHGHGTSYPSGYDNTFLLRVGGTGGDRAWSAGIAGGYGSILVSNSSAANASSAHNNLMPYQVFYIWRRTA